MIAMPRSVNSLHSRLTVGHSEIISHFFTPRNKVMMNAPMLKCLHTSAAISLELPMSKGDGYTTISFHRKLY